MSGKTNGKPRLDIFFHSRLNAWLAREKREVAFDVRLLNDDKVCSVTMYTQKAHITRKYIVSSFMNTSDLRGLVDLAVQHIYWELTDLTKKNCDG